MLLLTGVLGYGMTFIHTNVDVTDVLPRGDPNTDSAKNLTQRFKSAYTQQVTFVVTIDPALCAQDNAKLPFRQTATDCGNVTDEVYIRAMEEMEEHILSIPGAPFRYVIGGHSFYRLINWTVAGGVNAPDGAFKLPGTDPGGEALYRGVHEGVWRAISDAITAPMDPSHEAYANLYLVEAKEQSDLKDIGEWAFRARGSYLAAVAQGQTEYSVFGSSNPPLFFVDIPIANAHSSALVSEDFRSLLPVILGFFVVSLYVAFRNLRGIAIAGSTLAVSTVWTFGAMGWLDIALNTLNLTVVPLILGVGIDYGIHVITEFQEHQKEGLASEQVVALMGERSAFALFLATITTVVGLVILALSPSTLIGQVGLLCAAAMISIFLLSVMFIPALIALTGRGHELGKTFKPSRLMPAFGSAVSRGRAFVVVLLAGATVLALVSSQNLGIEAFGEPGKNFPADDWLRREHEAAIRDFYDLQPGQNDRKTNIIVFEGDMTDPAVHRYMDALQGAMRTQPGLDLNTSRNLPFLVRTWLTVKDGVPGAVAFLGREEVVPLLERLPALPPFPEPFPPAQPTHDPYPTTREEMRATLDEAFQSPLANFAQLFVDHPDYSISIMTFATETGSFEIAKRSWESVWGAVASVEDQRPPGLKVAFVGNTATNYLFIEKQLPWLNYLSAGSMVMVLALVGYFTRDLRASLTVFTMMLLTSVWLIGLLPYLGLGLAITLVLPLIFISALGSDYAVHMVWNIKKVGDPRHVYGVVGKSIMFSAVTSIGAFAAFTQMQNIPMARTMLASAFAVVLSFLLTALVLAVAYPFPRRGEPGRVAAAPPGHGGGLRKAAVRKAAVRKAPPARTQEKA